MPKKSVKNVEKCCTGAKYQCGGGAVYGLGFVGAVVYYVGSATSFWGGVLGFLKAIVWPAFLVYKLLNGW